MAGLPPIQSLGGALRLRTKLETPSEASFPEGLMIGVKQQIKSSAEVKMMNNEQNDKTMQFILEQQAKFSSDLAQLADSHVQAEKRISRLESAVVTGITLMNDLTTKVNNLTAQVSDLSGKFSELTEAQTHTDKRLDALINAQIQSDKRLEELIRTVNRYLEGRNGNPQTED